MRLCPPQKPWSYPVAVIILLCWIAWLLMSR